MDTKDFWDDYQAERKKNQALKAENEKLKADLQANVECKWKLAKELHDLKKSVASQVKEP